MTRAPRESKAHPAKLEPGKRGMAVEEVEIIEQADRLALLQAKGAGTTTRPDITADDRGFGQDCALHSTGVSNAP
jgi:hypothetical protein